MRLFIYLKDKHNLCQFSNNLFSKNLADSSKGGLYYYMRIYLEYQKDKSKNYLKLFRILSTHVKNCKKIDCPGHKLIPVEYLRSPFVPTTLKDNKNIEDEENINLKNEKNNEYILENETETNVSEENKNFEYNNVYNLVSNIQENLKNKDEKDKKNKNFYNDNKEFIICEQKRLTESKLQIIFEQEIVNKIDFLYKAKKSKTLLRMLITSI